nr:hypothetical protein JVH1_8721 [Rhodococcus sp. JVH1]
MVRIIPSPSSRQYVRRLVVLELSLSDELAGLSGAPRVSLGSSCIPSALSQLR